MTIFFSTLNVAEKDKEFQDNIPFNEKMLAGQFRRIYGFSEHREAVPKHFWASLVSRVVSEDHKT